MIAFVRIGLTSVPINLNCRNGVLIEHLRSRGGLTSLQVLDLSDKEGNVKNLRSNPLVYASSTLQQNEVYFIVSALEDGKQTTFSLLAEFTEDETPFEVKSTKIDKGNTSKRNISRSPKKRA